MHKASACDVGLERLSRVNWHLTDWLLYWQASEEAEAGRAVDTGAQLQSSNSTRPDSSPQPSSPSPDLNTNNDFKNERETYPHDHRSTSHLNLDTDIESHSLATAKQPFPYWPQVLFLGLISQILLFAFQVNHLRKYGLPGFIARWPILYALGAPANTCIYLVACVRMAPLRWPALRRWREGRFVELGERCVFGVGVVWVLGVWWVFS